MIQPRRVIRINRLSLVWRFGRTLRVCTDGSVYNWNWRRLCQTPNTHGYLRVRPYIRGKQRDIPVHGLVLEAFVGPKPKGKEARHLNGDKTDNRIENLKWGTRSENSRDQIRHGTAKCLRQYGVANHNYKITPEIRSRIIGMRGSPQRQIARSIGVSQASVNRVLRKVG